MIETEEKEKEESMSPGGESVRKVWGLLMDGGAFGRKKFGME